MTLDDETIEAIAQRVAELLRSEPMVQDEVIQDRQEPAPSQATLGAERLANWVRETLPEWVKSINGDLEDWSEAITAASGTADPKAAIAWALSPECPTSHWRNHYESRPLPAAARTSRGKFRYGEYLQLLAEYRMSRDVECEDVLHHVDELVDAFTRRVDDIGVNPTGTCGPRARKNACELLKAFNGEPNYILAVTDWCTAHRTHWRSNLAGVPPLKTFRKMRGDWVSAGQEFTLRNLDQDTAATIKHLADGWSYYLGQALGEPITLTASSHQRIHTLLLGTDGGRQLDVDAIKVTVKWICEPGAGRTRFYGDGADFPRPARIRKAWVDLQSTSESKHTSVAATNAAAGDGGIAAADDELRGIYE